MGGLKTLVVSVLGLLAVPSHAQVFDISAPSDPVRFFAACSGRLSAQMEFQWLMQDPAADQTREHRERMLDLLQAVMPQGAGPDVLTWRINAKMAHAALLTRGTFEGDTEDAAWARASADAALAQCTGMMLS